MLMDPNAASRPQAPQPAPSEIMDRVDAAVAGRRLLDHPFYTAWSEGRLSREALSRYAEQYYHWVSAFPTFLSLTHAQCPDLAARQAILENLIDEERGPDNHPELWLRFCDALGLDRDEVGASAVYPETREAIGTYRDVCAATPFTQGLTALYAYEGQQPEVMRTKREGLSTRYGIDTGHDFFNEHETADVQHSGDERRLIEDHASPGDAELLVEAAETGTRALYRLLDGVYARHVA
jgi:pyrroloquinoline-quinone synthase